LPQATTRRAKRAALSNPSPTTITFQKSVNSQTNPQLNILPMRGRMRSFDQGATRAPARKRCRRQRPEG